MMYCRMREDPLIGIWNPQKQDLDGGRCGLWNRQTGNRERERERVLSMPSPKKKAPISL